MLLFSAGFVSFPICAAALLALWLLVEPSATTFSCWSCGVITSHDRFIVQWIKRKVHRRTPAHKRTWKAWALAERAAERQGKQANLHALRWLEREGI